VEVNESRVWKDLVKSRRSSNTIFWRGISLFTIRGFERFEMQDFPFDRQLMSLDVFEFVWQQEKDSKDYDFSMHIVSFRIECVSMLPAWKSFPCIIQADQSSAHRQTYVSDVVQNQEPPQYASRFRVQLRIERKKWFYIYQLFCLTILITWATLLPLMMPAGEDHVGDRLSLYSGGVLTLTAVKYSVGAQLPCVPYMTKFDRIMFYEIATLVVCAFEALIAFRIVGQEKDFLGMDGKAFTGTVETLMFFGFVSFWGLMLVHLSTGDKLPCGMMHRGWKYIVEHQEAQADFDEVLNEDDGPTQSLTQRHPGSQLAKVSRDMCNYLAEGNEADEDFERLKMRRDALEEELAKRASPQGTRHSERRHQ